MEEKYKATADDICWAIELAGEEMSDESVGVAPKRVPKIIKKKSKGLKSSKVKG